VVSPGFLTTVQDLGRPGYGHLGISASGAADALSLRAGNRLVGNAEGAPALEMTLVGGTFEFESGAVVALAGAEFEANIAFGAATTVRAGEQVRCGPTRGGARCYLCVRGGIEAPRVLGSASAHLVSGIGRPLRKGDLLEIGGLVTGEPLRRRVPAPEPRAALRVTAGPQSGWFGEELYRAAWEVREDSNRMGLRLRGPRLERHAGAMLTEGAPLGAVQVPPEGQPIILFVEHQTTGGYPKIANVIAADLHRIGQLRPRDRVGFEPVSIASAVEMLREQEDWLRGLV
jgi:biotin-dependent carboxylase-like uncharacterized protein